MAIKRHLATGQGGRVQVRETSAARGYGSQWRRLRRMILAAEPLCRACGRLATDLDHVVPRAMGGTDSPANLQPLCRACHSSKTAVEDGGFGRGRVGGNDART